MKGTDGKVTLKRALELGAKPLSPKRAREALLHLKPFSKWIEIITCNGVMGESEARAESFTPIIVGPNIGKVTSANDTKATALEMLELGVDLILFVGGDGTARDIYQVINTKLPVLGVPSGVKMHSSVFALNPRRAIEIVVKFLRGEIGLTEAEIIDVDEEEYRDGKLKTRLIGYVFVPSDHNYIQTVKRASPITSDEKEDQVAIAQYVIEEMDNDVLYIIGPGTTTRAINKELGLNKTLLGVDLVVNKKLLAEDVSEMTILHELGKREGKIIVTPIGGQGFVFGRGNQQISPEVIKKSGIDNIIIVATPGKLSKLKPNQLFVDTGDQYLDNKFRGYCRVIVGYRQEAVMKIF